MGLLVSRTKAAGGGGADNPDGYPTSGTTYLYRTYSTENASHISAQTWMNSTWSSNQGHDGGGCWIFAPNAPDEDNVGLGTLNGSVMPAYPAAGGTRRVFYSQTIWLSSELIHAQVDLGGDGWKWYDVWQYDADGSGVSDDQDINNNFTRFNTGFGLDDDTDGHLRFAAIAGGANGFYSNDGVNTPINLDEHPEEWFWLCVVNQEGDTDADTYMKIYLKFQGGGGVVKTVSRDATIGVDGLDRFGRHKARGWQAGDKSAGGYFFSTGGWLCDGTETWKTSHLFIGDYWRGPPAGI